ncbi:MAG: hypothetical protein A2428_11605 [Bdellovibrionales bacterium RIFOXYC1_FULL_54_43]|nr:MAG: hypothetical protein A2428_11605 [Bdellovibrionales bacterium RIFOXYC1_FULL_54_43]OFZ82788.1 MAG: hypothetical protein A2603_04980 [Bdellovibrionales bacterium RIFOXYD1_FULL_55_31]
MRLIFLTIGVVAGYFLHEQIPPLKEAPLAPSCPSAPNTSAVAPIAQKPTAIYSKLELKSGEVITRVNEDRPIQERLNPARPINPATIKAEPQTFGLKLDDSIIQEWEKRLDQLRSLISTEELSDGWRIQIYQPDPLISVTGIQSGDLITYESFQAQFSMPDRAELAARFQAVLRSLRR